MYENMSAELRLKKLRGSGGFVMARVTDEQQSKGKYQRRIPRISGKH